MPSEESKSPLVLEFNRRLKAALELTRAYVDRESNRMFDLAFSVRLTKARNAEAEENHAMLVPDVDDPERAKSIKGDSQRARLLGALYYYRDVLFAGTRPVIREHFKPVAQIAATLIASGTVHFNEEGVTAEAFYITDGGGFLGIYEIWGLNLLGGVKIEPVRTGSNAIVTVLTQKATLRKLRRHERAVATATAAGAARNKNDFEDAFHGIFIEEWHQLLWKAQLETKAPLQPSMQTMPAVPGDARSRALAGESKNAAAEEESAEDRRRRTEQIGDRVISHLPPRSGAPAQQADQGISQLNIATLLKTPWKGFIAGIMLDHPLYSSKEICNAADLSRRSRGDGVTKKELAPPAPWMKASGEKRPREEYLLDEGLWVRVYESDACHALEVEFSKIRKKLRLIKRPAA